MAFKKKTAARSEAPTKTKKSNASPSWLRRGKAAHDEVAAEERRREERKRDRENEVDRFFLRRNEEGHSVIFVDGDLDDDGAMEFVQTYEHEIWTKTPQGKSFPSYFVCLDQGDDEEAEPCPLCEAENNQSSVSYLTVIHVAPPGSDGKRQATKKLFPFKTATRKFLTDHAEEYEGLAGMTFKVSRSGDQRSPKVGDSWVVTRKGEKFDAAELDQKFGEGSSEPFDYAEVLARVEASELNKIVGQSASKADDYDTHETPEDGVDFADDEDDL